MRQRSAALLAIAILLLLLIPAALSASIPSKVGMLSSSPSYNENLSLYLTSSETFWRASFSGGNVSIPSLSIPSSVTSFSITLTHYQTWKSQFEIFTKNGFGLLGPSEPLPDGAILVVNTTSSADASSLASSLDSMFALVFSPYSNSSSSFSFISPLSFQTVVHAYLWKLLPASYQGFASQFTEAQLESNDLAFYSISFSSGIYTIAIGGVKPLVSTSFSLYSQLGIASQNFTYSRLASSSSVAIHILGGLVSKSNSTFTNHLNNFSASMFTGSQGGSNVKVPNLNATLDFAFPTVVATRQISTLNPTTNQTVGVTITIKNASPSGTPSASNVKLNDSWVKTAPGDFRLTQGNTTANQNLSAGQSISVAYAFQVLHGSGKNFSVPAIPVTYEFSAANQTVQETVYLNTETLTINGTGPAIEATTSITSGTVRSGQPLSINISVVNKGGGPAFNLVAAGQNKGTLLAGQSLSFVTSSQSALTQTNSTIGYSVSWQPAPNNVLETNTISSVYSFSTPGSPASSLSKIASYFKSSNTVNVTLSVLDNSGVAISNLTIRDSVPLGMSFAKSYAPSSLTFSGGLISVNVSSIKANQNESFTYSMSVSSLNQNYVFLPANVSSLWNNMTIVHYSEGSGLALGVSGYNQISPSSGFQGSLVSVQIGITNKGSLPIYDVTLSPASETFLAISGGGSSFKSVLPAGSSANSTLQGNLTGVPGTYNSSSSTATFVFAGYNESASTNVFTVTIFEPVSAQLSVVSGKVEEDHNMVISVAISNPSNVTVSNVGYSMTLPNNLNLVSGKTSFSGITLAPNGSYKNNFTISTTLPEQYTLKGSLSFQYSGQTLKGQATPLTLRVADDLTIRYGIPVLIGIVVVIATLVYVRRLTKPKS